MSERRTSFGKCPKCGVMASLNCARCKKEVVHCPNCVSVGQAAVVGRGPWMNETLCNDCLDITWDKDQQTFVDR